VATYSEHAFWSDSNLQLDDGVTGIRSSQILPPRPNHVYNLLGYRMGTGISGVSLVGSADKAFVQTMLVAGSSNPFRVKTSPQPSSQGSLNSDNLGGSRIIDLQRDNIKGHSTAPGVFHGETASAWARVNLLVPSILVMGTSEPVSVNNVDFQYWASVEFVLVRASSTLLAAVSLAWGIDPMDKIASPADAP